MSSTSEACDELKPDSVEEALEGCNESGCCGPMLG